MGSFDVACAGGMENMDRAAYLIARARWGHRMGDGQLYDSMLRDGLNDAFSDEHSGWHTEDLAEKFQIDRPAQDEWALRSQQRFSTAQEAGKFKDEIVPVELPGRKGATIFDKDEHNRPQTTLEALAALRPAFRKDGTITAGNAPGVVLPPRLIHSMRRDGLRRGIVTMCIGGGQGIALALETIN